MSDSTHFVGVGVLWVAQQKQTQLMTLASDGRTTLGLIAARE